MRQVGSPPDVPVLVFDGECGFCRFWVDRWRHYTGDRVEYLPSQSPDLTRRFPDVPRERFARAVQLIEVGGRLSEGAEAVFRLLALGGRPAALWAHEHVWGLAAVTEGIYRLIANHRPFAARITTLLWGRTAAPS